MSLTSSILSSPKYILHTEANIYYNGLLNRHRLRAGEFVEGVLNGWTEACIVEENQVDLGSELRLGVGIFCIKEVT